MLPLQYLIGEMKKAGMAPDVLTYGSMITAFANVRRPRRAAGVMQDFIDEGGQVTLRLTWLFIYISTCVAHLCCSASLHCRD